MWAITKHTLHSCNYWRLEQGFWSWQVPLAPAISTRPPSCQSQVMLKWILNIGLREFCSKLCVWIYFYPHIEYQTLPLLLILLQVRACMLFRLRNRIFETFCSVCKEQKYNMRYFYIQKFNSRILSMCIINFDWIERVDPIFSGNMYNVEVKLEKLRWTFAKNVQKSRPVSVSIVLTRFFHNTMSCEWG